MLQLLIDHCVDFIIVGGAAAVAHGSIRLTEDLDIVYGRTSENIKRLAEALDVSIEWLILVKRAGRKTQGSGGDSTSWPLFQTGLGEIKSSEHWRILASDVTWGFRSGKNGRP